MKALLKKSISLILALSMVMGCVTVSSFAATKTSEQQVMNGNYIIGADGKIKLSDGNKPVIKGNTVYSNSKAESYKDSNVTVTKKINGTEKENEFKKFSVESRKIRLSTLLD